MPQTEKPFKFWIFPNQHSGQHRDVVVADFEFIVTRYLGVKVPPHPVGHSPV